MRVTIEQRERFAGILRSGRQVEVVVQAQFSEAELLIIEQRELDDFIVLERAPDSRLAASFSLDEQKAWDGAFHLRIRDLLTTPPDRFTLDTLSDAKAYQARLADALRQLSLFIAENAELGGPTGLEL
jgi:hypothetical protein